jgi:hypothetical protein
MTEDTQAPKTERLPFDVEYQQHVEAFAAQVMAAVPELAAVAVIPLWANQPEKIAPGYLHLRDPNSPYMRTLFVMLDRLSAFGREILNGVVGQIHLYNLKHNELIEQITTRETQLQQLNQTAQPATKIDDK